MSVRSWRFVAFAAFVLVPAVLPLTGCSPSGYQKRSDGVVLRLDKTAPTDARLMRIQVCTDEIIRVVAVPTETFSDRPSLMVAQTNWKSVPFSVEQREDLLEIATSRLIA